MSGTKSSMKTGEFIALSASFMTLVAFGIDVMLPSFKVVREYFALENPSATANIITFFFMGQITQVLFGVLSDRFGRLFTLRIGFLLYIIGGVLASYAPSFQVMLAFRFVAGVGSASVMMSTIAGVRDRFEGDRMAHIMSLILTVFLFTPILAPFLGAALLKIMSWRAVFLSAPVFATLVFLWSFRLNESLPREKRISLSWKRITDSVHYVISNKTFLRYTGITTILFTAFSSYIASSEWIVGEIYHRPELFIWLFAGIGILMSISTLINSRLSSWIGARKAIKVLISIYLASSLFLLIVTLVTDNPPAMWIFFCTIALLTSLNVAMEPNSSSLALKPMGEMAGMASAIYGTSFFFIGSFIGTFISSAIQFTIFPLIFSFFIIGLVCLMLVFSDQRAIDKD